MRHQLPGTSGLKVCPAAKHTTGPMGDIGGTLQISRFRRSLTRSACVFLTTTLIACASAPYSAAQPAPDAMTLRPDIRNTISNTDASDRRDRNVAAVHHFLDLLEAPDLDAWADLWTELAVLEAPYAPGGPLSVNGRDNIAETFGGLYENYGEAAFRNRDVRPLFDPDAVVATWHTDIELLAGPDREPSGRYENDIIALFTFDEDGRIVRYVEYFDPIPFLRMQGKDVPE